MTNCNENWLATVGKKNAALILREAGEFGDAVHKKIEDFLRNEVVYRDTGQAITIYPVDPNENGEIDSSQITKFDWDVWRAFNKFVSFWKLIRHESEILEIEGRHFDVVKGFGYTLDFKILFRKKYRIIIDHKTSNSIQDTAGMQLSAIKDSQERLFRENIDYIFVFWPKASTRTEKFEVKTYSRGAKKGQTEIIAQGKGWQLVDMGRKFNKNLKKFNLAKEIFEMEVPDWEPKHRTLPLSINPEFL